MDLRPSLSAAQMYFETSSVITLLALHADASCSVLNLHSSRVSEQEPILRHLVVDDCRRRAALASWRMDYNVHRPHSRLGWQTPFEFANDFSRRDGTRRYAP